ARWTRSLLSPSQRPARRLRAAARGHRRRMRGVRGRQGTQGKHRADRQQAGYSSARHGASQHRAAPGLGGHGIPAGPRTRQERSWPVTISRETLDELTTLELRPAVSILMPTHHAGPEIRQDPIRFKNLVREVEHKFAARDLGKAEIAQITGPAHPLIDDRAFWRHQQQGLAVYAAPNFFRSYWAPRPFREIASISDHFHVTQLFSSLVDSTRFYVLALSQKDIRLIEATRTSAAEVDLGNLPRSLAEALSTEPPGQELQQHVVTTAGGERGVMFHGHGAGLLDQRKEAIRQFFHQLDHGLPSLLPDRPPPLVLAGVEYLLSIYREANSHPAVLPEGIAGNPEQESAQTLGSRGWEIVSRH